MTRTAHRRRVHIVGGGLAGLTTAFELSATPALRDRYELTVHQPGWRLGGKCASGRNPARHQRIEEHGPHVWMGCYDNAFRLIQAVYDELDRPPSARLATWEQAFAPQERGAVLERFGPGWVTWPLEPPPNGRRPGDGGPALRPADYVEMTLRYAARSLRVPGGGPVGGDGGPGDGCGPPGTGALLRGALGSLAALASRPGRAGRRAGPPGGPRAPEEGRLLVRLDRLRRLLGDGFARRRATDLAFRRGWIGAEYALVLARGLLADGLLGGGLGALDALDGEDLRAWLRRHGASDDLLRCGPTTELYDLCFSYPDGLTPDFAAGAGLRSLIRAGLTYKGALLYTMQAGMGESVIAPLYRVLERRGVRFRFFSRLRRLEPTADGRSVGRLLMEREATPRGGRYEPLVDVRGLPCWPVEPLYEQLREGEALRAIGPALESVRSGRPPVERNELRAGRDFDTVVLAVGGGALRSVASSLAAVDDRWNELLRTLPTVGTCAAQVWLKPTREELGWRGDNAFIGGYAPPFRNWADLSHLLVEEGAPPGTAPRSLAYLCGPMPDPRGPSTEDGERASVRAQLGGWLDAHAAGIWPGTARGGGFDYSLLVDPEERRGRGRLAHQFVRANLEPTDRYVVAGSGTIAVRPRAGESGFDNLVLAGDWIFNGFNAACVEGAVMSGLQAARAIEGGRAPITGEGSAEPR